MGLVRLFNDITKIDEVVVKDRVVVEKDKRIAEKDEAIQRLEESTNIASALHEMRRAETGWKWIK